MQDAEFRNLMSQFRSGNSAALSSLLVAAFTPLRTTIAHQMGDLLSQAQAEPEDVIQEAYAAAWASAPSSLEFETFQAFLGWLRQIAENKLIDMQRAMTADKRDIRRQTPAWAMQSGTYVNLLDQVNSPMSTPSVGAAHNEAMAVLMVQMLQLPEDYRRVIQWRLLDGLPVSEVARRLERSEAAVHMLFHRALKQLRDLMGAAANYLTHT
jgi:RNA polymerase sigma-70 factor (ECF subfamily)